MLRTILASLLVGLTLAVPSTFLASSDTVQLLVERPSQSLRGEVIDLDDRWNAARLLAHFGESKRAYDVLRSWKPNDAIAPQVERFEARLLAEIGLPERADSILALQSYSGDQRAYYQLCLQRSRLNLMAGDYNRALGFLSLIDTLVIPAFEPYKDYLKLESLMRAERFGEACAAGERRLAKGIPVSLSPRFEEHLLDAYLGAGKHEKALQFVRVLKARRARRSGIGPVLVREVDILFQMGDTLGAVDVALGLIKDRRTRDHAESLAEGVVAAVALDAMSDEALLEFGEVFVRASNLAAADRITSTLSKRRLKRSEEERLRLLRGELYYKEKRYSKSYGFVAGRFSDAPLERRAALLRARIYRRTGQPVRSANTYVEFARKFPYDSKAPEAVLVASELYLASGNRKRSMEMLERVVETYPGHRYGRLATKRMALYYLDRKHYSRGIAILERAVERTRRKNQELLYYLADGYGRMGKTATKAKVLDELRELNPVSFYLAPHVETSFYQPVITSSGSAALYGDDGLLQFLKGVFGKRQEAYRSVREALKPLSETDRNLERNAVYLERGRDFLQMGFRDWAESELRALESTRRLPARVWFELGVLYDDFAMHWKSMRAFQRVYYSVNSDTRDALEGHFKLLMYPVPYPVLVFENCSRYGVPPHLIFAMIREESKFDLNAVSSAGAMGLMQLMPATSEQVAGQLGFPRGVDHNLLTPDINLTFGIWYASHLLARAGDDPLMMLSAYNAGFGNARRWFGSGGAGADTIAMVDGIDYRETRNYVKRIVESARVYHRFYFGPGAVTGSSPR